MNEPVYAALLFDQYCFVCRQYFTLYGAYGLQNCGKAHSKKVDCYLDVRLCGKCWSQKYISIRRLAFENAHI